MVSTLSDSLAAGLQWLDPFVARIKRVPVTVWRRLCLILFGIVLAWCLARLFWVIMPRPDIPKPPLTSPVNTVFAVQPVGGASSVDIESLKQLALFGDGTGDAAPVPVQAPSGIESEAVDTSLSLTLVGTIASGEDRASRAFIEDGSEHDSFSPGDELTLGPRGVTLAKVMKDRVILDNNGRYETLWLYQGENDFANRQPVANNRPITTRRPVARPDNDRRRARDLVNAVRPEEGQTAPSARQISTVNELINVSMHREGGQLVGFKINPKRDRQLFEQLGLQPNDVITAVNNTALNDTSQAMEVYRSLSTASQATLEIMRDGTTVSVDINLNQ